MICLLTAEFFLSLLLALSEVLAVVHNFEEILMLLLFLGFFFPLCFFEILGVLIGLLLVVVEEGVCLIILGVCLAKVKSSISLKQSLPCDFLDPLALLFRDDFSLIGGFKWSP